MSYLKAARALLAALILAVAVPRGAAAVPGDYNGDNLSDYAIALVSRQGLIGSTAWLARHNLTDPSAFSYFTFAHPGDALFHGSFFEDGRTYPGIVFVRSAQLPLEWYIKTPGGGEVFLQFGSPGMMVPNQMDVDCDGRTDLTVVSPGSAEFPLHAVWHTALSGSGGAVVQQIFGLRTDRLGFSDIDGDGCGEMYALRPGEYNWYTKEFFGVDVTSVQWGLNGDKPLPPVVMNGKTAYIIARQIGGRLVAFIRYADKSTDTVTMGFDSSIAWTGRYNETNNNLLAWAQRDTGFTALRKQNGDLVIGAHGIPQNAHITPYGHVYQPTDTGVFPAGGGGGGGGGGAPGECRGMADGREGRLWKPHAEAGPGAVVLMPSRFQGVSLSVQDSAGNVVARTVRNNCCKNGGREHRWLNRSGSSLESDAPIFLKWGNGECYVVNNPANRVD